MAPTETSQVAALTLAGRDGGPLRVVVATTVHQAHDQRIVAREAATLAAHGVDVVVVAQGEVQPEAAHGLRHVALPTPRNRAGRLLLQWRVLLELARVRPDVVHVHDPELVPMLVAARVLGSATVYDAHESLVDDLGTKAWIPRPVRTPARATARILLGIARRCGTVVAATETIAATFDPPATVVANYPRLSELAQVQPSLDGTTVVYVGGLQRIRGIDVVVRAMQQLAGVRLVLAGTFTEPDYEAEVRALDVHGVVTFLGWQDRGQVADVLAGASAGVIPFLSVPNHEEAMPTKLFEYMAAGVPVVASDLPGITSVLDATGAGRTFATGSADDCAAVLADLLARPGSLRTMSDAGRAAAVHEYNWESASQALVATYRAAVR